MTYSWGRRRWKWQLAEQFSYLPNALGSFGGAPVIGGTLVRPDLLPNQSIFGLANRTSTSTALQLRYALGPRSSFTVAGSYSFLRIQGANFGDTDQAGLNFSFDRQLTARSSVGLTYSGGLIRYPDAAGLIDTHSVELGYSRGINGRISMSASVGPQLYTLRDFGTGSPSTSVSWSGRLGLAYQFPRTRTGLTYFHSVMAGAGALQGSKSDQITADISRPLTRSVSAGFSGGYSRNADITSANVFNSFFGGANISRQLSRNIALFADYRAFYQQVTFAAGSDLRHLVGIGFSFQGRPIARW